MCILTKALQAVAVCTLFATLGCSSVTRAPQNPAPNADIERVLYELGPSFSQAVLAASSSGWAVDPVETLVNRYSKDAILFPPTGDPIVGRDAIRRYWSRTADRRILAHSIVVDGAEMSGNLLVEHGHFTLTAQSGDTPPVTSTLNYISAWRRDSGGVWRKRLDSWW